MHHNLRGDYVKEKLKVFLSEDFGMHCRCIYNVASTTIKVHHDNYAD